MKNFLLIIALVLGQLSSIAQVSPPQKLDANVKLKSSGSSSIILEANTVGVNYKNHSIQGKVWKSIDMPEMASLLIGGAPDLQLITTSVVIPDLKNMDVKVVNVKFKEFNNIEIAPSKGNLTRDIDPNQVPYQFSNVYQKDAFFPGKLAELRTPYIFRDYRAQTVVFYPFQYNPVTKTLRVYQSIEVELNESNSSQVVNPFIRTQAKHATPFEFEQLYQHQFINYSPQKYTPVTETGNLLIIADSAYMLAMKPYVDWKIQTGRHTEMVSIQSVGNTTTAIKNYISNYYNNKGLSFVLLVGDANKITTNSLSGDHSDNYYGYLSGSDSYPEVIIGRFSAESIADVNTQVGRTIEYELSPGAGNGSYTRSMGISSNQGPGDDNEYDYTHIRNMQLDLDSFTYHYQAELFDGSQGGNDAAGNPSSTMVANELNNGTGVILYTGHGSSSSFVSSGFSSSHIASLSNVGKLPFIWSVACVNGDFVGKTCFAEYWLRSTNSGGGSIGAVATLMSTINQSWDPPMEGQDEMVDVLVESYQNNIKRTFGGLSMSGCMKMNDTYGSQGDEMTDTWMIFGDPTLMVRTDTPAVLTVTHPQTLNIGMTQMNVNVSIDGALIALTKGDSIYGTAVSTNGIASLTFPSINVMDTFMLTATAFNHIPYTASLQAISTSLPFVTSIRYYVNDSLTNNNRIVENGENIRLAVCLQNTGGIIASNVTATLRTNSPFVTITDSTEVYGNMNISDSIMKDQAFEITINSQVLNQTSIPFTIIIKDNTANQWLSGLNLVVAAPQLNVVDKTLAEIGGNGNLVPDAGETVEVSFKLKNVGANQIQNINCTASSASSFINFSSSSMMVTQLLEDSFIQCTYMATISQSVPDGERIFIDFNAINGIYQTSEQVSFRVGLVDEDFETGDFSKYYWVHSGNKPWVTDQTEKFEGNYSARSGLTSNDLNMASTMEIGVRVKTIDSISFYAKVSCEDGSTWNQWYDYLEFEIDGQSKKRWQGEVDWERNAFPVDTGVHVLTWTYSKDNYMSEGADCGWVDYIVFPPLHSSVGMDHVVSDIQTSLYPNPTQESLNLSFSLNQNSTVEIQVYTKDGKLVYHQNSTVYMTGQHSEKLSVSNMSSGIYVVVISVDGMQKSIPFVKL